MSVIHPGSSINFDGADLQRSEEEEIQQEDIKQQRELQELLSAELPEDLLEDSCDGSLNSPADHRSYDNSRNSSTAGGWQQGRLNEGASPQTSQMNDPQPYYGHQVAPVRYNVSNGYAQDNYNNYDRTYTDAEKWQMHQHQQLHFNHNFHQVPMRDSGVGEYGYRGNNPEPNVYGFAERREAEGSEDFDAVSHNDSYHRYDNKLSVTLPSFSSPASRTSTTPSKNVRFDAFSAPTSPYNQYGVQYKPMNRYQYHSSEAINHQPSPAKADDSIGSDYVDASDRNTPDETSDSRELGQLRILYEARGKKIDKLTREIEGLQQDGDREKRILNHQLAMAKDQKVGMSGSLEECQRLLMEKDRVINDEQGKANAFKIEVESLKSAKSEFVKKIEVCERTIENLQQEVVMLQRSDALERSRQQHEAVLSAANERHEQQLLEVSSMLDEVRRVADLKTEESEQLRVRLKAALKESEDVLLEKTETINRLSRNLEDAQNHCQTLLAGSGETAYLQRQMNELTAVKTTMEEKNKTLQGEIAELQQNLSMYESAFQLGATPRPLTSDGLTESYSELMGVKRNIDWKTPKPVGKFKGQPENLVGSLRHELERALTNNKEKRDQVTELQKQINELNDESRHWRERVDEAEQRVKVTNSNTMRTKAPPRGQMDEEIERQFEESLERVDVAEERALRLEETCRDLKQQMCEMVEQHDANKQEAVDRCERACMQLHEDAKQAMRDEFLAEQEQKLYEMSVEHDGRMQELKKALDEVSNELSEVKQSYVHVCSEKDGLEKQLLGQHDSEKQALLLKSEREKDEIRESMEEEWDKRKREEEKDWEKDKEEIVNARITLAKVAWMEEHANLREDNMREVMKSKEDEFNKRIESLRSDLKVAHEKEVDAILNHEKALWDEEKKQEIESRMDELYEELKEEKNTAVTVATSLAQLNWMTEKENSTEIEYQKRIDEARRSWKEEHDRLVDQKVNEALKNMQSKIEVLNEERDALVREELSRAEREWKKKRDESLRRRDDEMQEELRNLQHKHENEYEEFTNQHKKSLEKFLENERLKTSSKEKQNDALDEMQKQWSAERDHLSQGHQSELQRLQEMYETRCRDYRSEIQRLSSSYDAMMRQRSTNNENDSKKISEIQQKHKEDTEKLKGKMKDEYRRWKRERSNLLAKLEEAKNQPSATNTPPPSGGMDPTLLVDLREIYVGTLGSIKDEMLDFIREGRTRSVNAVKLEAQRERHRILGKLRCRSRETDESILPSFLADHQSFSAVDRFPPRVLSNPPITAPSQPFQPITGPSQPAQPIKFQGGVFIPPTKQMSARQPNNTATRGRSRDKSEGATSGKSRFRSKE